MPELTSAPAAQSVDRAAAILGARRQWRLLALLGSSLIALALVVAVADGAVALDVWSRRLAVPLWLGAGGVLALGLALARRRLRPSAVAAAQQAEAVLGDRDRRLTAALELEALGGSLAGPAAQRLSRAAGPLDRLPELLPRARVARPLLLAIAVVVGAGIVHLVQPRFWPTVLPRFLDASGDHPPFSLTELRWAELPERVPAGRPARITVQVSGRPTRDLVLRVAPAGSGLPLPHDDASRLPMVHAGAGRWSAEILRVEADCWLWVEGGGTRTHVRVLPIDPVPRLAALECALIAPAYARLADETKRWQPGSAPVLYQALPDSQLRILARANRPLAALELRSAEDGDAPTLRAELDADGLVTLPAVVGAWRVVPIGSDGLAGPAIDALAIQARSDEPPRVSIISPGRDAAATPTTKLPLVLAADDDLGLAQISLHRAANGLAAPERVTVVEGREWRSETVLDLSTLGVQPGDTIEIGLMARDRLPTEGQPSSSARRTITVISEQAYNRLLRRNLKPDAMQAKYRPVLERLAALEREAREANAAEPSERERRLAALAREAAALAREVQALHRDQPLFQIERDIQQALRAAAERLAQAAGSNDPSEMERALDRLMAEAMSADLAQMAELARASGMLARLRLLAEAEQRTAARLAPMAEPRSLGDDERLRLRELANAERSLAEMAAIWPQQAREIAERLSDGGADGPAEQLRLLAAEVEVAEIAKLKQNAAAAADAGDGIRAHQQATEAARRLQAMLPRAASGAIAAACQGFGWCSGFGLGQAVHGLGMGFGLGDGFGAGGSGSGGLGMALGYGGNDQGASGMDMAMDLHGPENLGDLGGRAGNAEGPLGAARALAGPGQAVTLDAGRGSTANPGPGAAPARLRLNERERQAIDSYRQRLGER